MRAFLLGFLAFLVAALVGAMTYPCDNARTRTCWDDGSSVNGFPFRRAQAQRRTGAAAVVWPNNFQFEFAPYDGGGMGPGACDCSSVQALTSGGVGVDVTLTRATTATCLKHSETQNIANGDLVTCASGKPSIQPGLDGGGALGLKMERAATSRILRSEEFGNAAYVGTNSVIVSAPTVTTDYAVAPDGTATAERIQFNDCSTAASASVLTQAVTMNVGREDQAVFVKSTDGVSVQNGSLCVYDTVALAGGCTGFAADGGWQRIFNNYTIANGASRWEIGCQNQTLIYSGAGSTGAADLLVWGATLETPASSGWPTRYIKVVAANATRNADTATAAWTIPADGGQFYVTGRLLTPDVAILANSVPTASVGNGTTQEGPYMTSASGTLQGFLYNGSALKTWDSTLTVTYPGNHVIVMTYDGSSKGNMWRDGTKGTTATLGAYTKLTGAQTVNLGWSGAGNQSGGTIKNICFDNGGDAGVGSTCP